MGDVVDEERIIEWIERRERDCELDVCPSCAHRSIDAASPYGFCARCTTDRLIEEDDGRRPRARLRTRLGPLPDLRVGLAVNEQELAELAPKVFEHLAELVGLCTRCARRPAVSDWWCEVCSEERRLEIEVAHEREKARQREWWATFGNEWRHGRRKAAKEEATN